MLFEIVYRGLRSRNVWIKDETDIILSGFEYASLPNTHEEGDVAWRYIEGDEPYVGPDQLKKQPVDYFQKQKLVIQNLYF